MYRIYSLSYNLIPSGKSLKKNIYKTPFLYASISIMNNAKFSGTHLMRRFIQGSLLMLCVIIPLDEGGNGYILQLITQLVLLACGTVWGLQVIRTRKILLKYDWIDIIVLGGIVWIGISLAISDYKYATIFEGLKVLSYVAVWFLSRILFSSKKVRGLVLFTIVVSGFIQFLIAGYNALIKNTATLQAGFVNPNNLAAFFVTGLSIALSFLLFRQHSPLYSLKTLKFLSHRRVLFIDVVVCIVIICFGAGTLLIQSRGAIISLVITSLLITTLKKKRAGLILSILLVATIFSPAFTRAVSWNAYVNETILLPISELIFGKAACAWQRTIRSLGSVWACLNIMDQPDTFFRWDIG